MVDKNAAAHASVGSIESINSSKTSSVTAAERGRYGAGRRSGSSLERLTPQATRHNDYGSLDRVSQRNSRDAAADGSKDRHDDGASSPASKLQRYANKALWFAIDQYFLIGLAVVITIASQVQVPQPQQQIKETLVTYLCVAIIFFITGCTLPTRTLVENYSRWKLHLFVQAQCFLMTSATTFAIVSACATNPAFMDSWLLLGLIFLGCVPTTISSNVVMTRQANGNTALTVVQSTIGNFLAPFLAPLLVSMYTSSGAWYTRVLPSQGGSYSEIYKRVFKQLGLSLFLPMVVGQAVQNLFPNATSTVFGKLKLSKLSSAALLVIIWQTYDSAFASGAFASVKPSNMIFIVFISVGMFLLWLGISLFTSVLWLPKKDTIAVAYCVPAKTPAMGVPLSTVMYLGLRQIDESKLQIPMVIYQGLQIAGGSLLTLAFRTWIERDEAKQQDNADADSRHENETATANA